MCRLSLGRKPKRMKKTRIDKLYEVDSAKGPGESWMQ